MMKENGQEDNDEIMSGAEQKDNPTYYNVLTENGYTDMKGIRKFQFSAAKKEQDQSESEIEASEFKANPSLN